MPDTNRPPLVTDDKARELFRLNGETQRCLNALDLQKELASEAKRAYDKAVDAERSFTRNLSAEVCPLFDGEAGDERASEADDADPDADTFDRSTITLSTPDKSVTVAGEQFTKLGKALRAAKTS